MKEESVTDAGARRFLLGDVDEEERRRIEGLFISDPESEEKILIAEDALIEDYLEASLTASDRDKFLTQYGYSPQQRRKLRIGKSIRDYAIAEARPGQAAPSAISKPRTFFSALRLRNPLVFVPVAAALTIGLVIAVVWLVDLNSRRVEVNHRRVAIEQELVTLNEPASLREVPPQLFAITLAPGSVRSVGPQTELIPRTDLRVVELQLLWIQKEQYPSYRAVLRRVGNTEEFTIPNLHIENHSGGGAVRVRLPAHILTRGLYQISLSGIAGGGAPGPAQEYSFAVGD